MSHKPSGYSVEESMYPEGKSPQLNYSGGISYSSKGDKDFLTYAAAGDNEHYNNLAGYYGSGYVPVAGCYNNKYVPIGQGLSRNSLRGSSK